MVADNTLCTFSGLGAEVCLSSEKKKKRAWHRARAAGSVQMRTCPQGSSLRLDEGNQVPLPTLNFLTLHKYLLMDLLVRHKYRSLRSLVARTVKNLPVNAGDIGSLPWSGRAAWRRAWQPTPVLLPGEPHGQMNLAGYSPGGHKSWTQLSG